jgi:hypothetical protein
MHQARTGLIVRSKGYRLVWLDSRLLYLYCTLSPIMSPLLPERFIR